MNILKILGVLAVIIFVFWFILWKRYQGKVLYIGKDNIPFNYLEKKKLPCSYSPHWKFGLDPMVNTGAAFSQNKSKYRPTREILYGEDGGEFGIDWFVDDKHNNFAPDAPILVLVHGLSGGSSEPYLQKLGLRTMRKLGWRTVCVLFRGCCGTKLTTHTIYNGAFTSDLHVALRTISDRFPKAKIALVGYSLGANVIAKYLGERTSKQRPAIKYKHVTENQPIPKQLICAVSICCPFDLVNSDKIYNDKLQLFLGKPLLKYLAKHRDSVKTIEGFEEMEKKFNEAGDFRCRVFDNTFTCKLSGYNTGLEYYADASSARYIDGIQIPTLFISAKNDPISLYSGIPLNEIEKNKMTGAIITPCGGHLGFFSMFDTAKTLDEEIVVEFVSKAFNSDEEKTD